ncbi:hypothetical protein [Streptomyces chattanoogensis]|uniref:hypothetical protein n=1 Tax=Streptomyces chattanoogensis TaxID=66876 RepID=UPI0036966747
MLPCTTGTAAVQPCPGVLDALSDRLRALDRQSLELAAAREVLRETIAGAEGRRQPAPPVSARLSPHVPTVLSWPRSTS